MMGKLPRVTAAEAIKVLERVGFLLVRQSGSHKIYKNREGKRVTVPYHTGRTLHPKVLQSILRDANLTVKRFRELLK
jgi:predicted RNA binding protein YcfA (HicA-like mRNA interferase family)